MMKTSSKELTAKLEKLSIKESPWKERAKYRDENSFWLSRSKAIALKILRRLRETGTTQKELAGRMGVFPQQVNKWVKGKENFTLETIGRIEKELGIELIQINVSVTFVNLSITSPISDSGNIDENLIPKKSTEKKVFPISQKTKYTPNKEEMAA